MRFNNNNNMVSKTELVRFANENLYTLQRLYNISGLGLWGQMTSIMANILEDVPETLTPAQAEVVRQNLYAATYAIVDND